MSSFNQNQTTAMESGYTFVCDHGVRDDVISLRPKVLLGTCEWNLKEIQSSERNLVHMVLLCFINRLKVKYKIDETDDNQVGEILLLVPRKPSPDDDKDVEDAAARSTDPFPTFDQPHGLDPGMVLRQPDVDKLTLCCCECCHRSLFRGCSSWFCNAFPQHITANQFFTPRMFEAYHREGYRACKEAEDWFKGESQQQLV